MEGLDGGVQRIGLFLPDPLLHVQSQEVATPPDIGGVIQLELRIMPGALRTLGTRLDLGK